MNDITQGSVMRISTFLLQPKYLILLNSFSIHEFNSSVNFLNLFQYMMILFIVFIVQFSVSCACLALNKDQQVSVLFGFFPVCLVQVSVKGILYLLSLSLNHVSL